MRKLNDFNKPLQGEAFRDKRKHDQLTYELFSDFDFTCSDSGCS